jgi:hypothetical protein
MFKLVCEYKVEHNDIARYMINLQCHEQDIKRVLQKNDAKDIYMRISTMGIMNTVQDPLNFMMPDEMVCLMNTNYVYKVEWMRNGAYVVNSSPSYCESIMDKETTLEIAGRADVPRKLVDTLNCGNFQMAYRMWVQSIENPMTAIKATAPVYWKDTRTVCTTAICMMSKLITPTSIVSITVLNRGSVYTF